MSSVMLEPLGPSNEAELSRLLASPAGLQHCADFPRWIPQRLQRTLEYAASDWHRGAREERDYYWAVKHEGQVIGFVGMQRPGRAARYCLEVLIGENNQPELGRFAVQQALRLFAAHEPGHPVDSMVRDKSKGGAELLLSAGFRERSPRRHFVCDTPANTGASSAGVILQTPLRSEPAAKRIRLDEATGKKTYLALLDHLAPAVMDALMQPLGWHAVTLEEALSMPMVDVLLVDGEHYFDKRIYNVRAALKGRILGDPLTNKVELHMLMNKHFPGTIADTVVVPGHLRCAPSLPDASPWIWRPEGLWQGKGIEVLADQTALDRVWRDHARTTRGRKRALLSRYIMNPLLMPNGSKFHIRLHLLVVVTPAGKRAAVYREGELVNAGEPFVAGDFANKEVHDSHKRSSDINYFPADYPGGQEAAAMVTRRTTTILSQACSVAMPGVKWYEESQGGFEILGCDFMVDRTGRVYLIEINTKPSFNHPKDTPERINWLSSHLLQGVIEYVIQTPKPGASLTQLVSVYDTRSVNALPSEVFEP